MLLTHLSDEVGCRPEEDHDQEEADTSDVLFPTLLDSDTSGK